MERSDLEYIVDLVTKQVLSAVQGRGEAAPGTEGLPRVLLVGDGEAPEELTRDAVLCGLEDYQSCKNILRYDRVVVTHLTCLQLADIALGRPADPASCAVLYALLSGVDVYLTEDALSFRRFAGKGSTALYHLLEGYAQTLQVFGIKQVSRQRRPEPPPAKPPKFSAPAAEVPVGSAAPNAGRLITEARALELVRQGGEIRLPQRAILTPAARDVFAQAGVKLRES